MDEPRSGGAMMIDIKPGAITIATEAGQIDQFETIGEALQHILDAYRRAEGDSKGINGDFLAGYTSDSSLRQRDPTARDQATARRIG